MPHIDLPSESPGIRGLFEFRPQTAAPLRQLAEQVVESGDLRSR